MFVSIAYNNVNYHLADDDNTSHMNKQWRI